MEQSEKGKEIEAMKQSLREMLSKIEEESKAKISAITKEAAKVVQTNGKKVLVSQIKGFKDKVALALKKLEQIGEDL